MNTKDDPRTRGFNYAGWGASPKPPVYHTAQMIARDLNAKAKLAGDEAWTLEMKIRDVRLATTSVEKIQAVANLEAYIERYQGIVVASLPTLPGKPEDYGIERGKEYVIFKRYTK